MITSATIDPERFAEHFADAQGRPAPIIEVTGRTYPVEVRYRPLVDVLRDGSSLASSGTELDEEDERVERDQTEAIEDAVDELIRDTDGDVLVFLPGEREIRDTADALKRRAEGPRGFDIVPLFSRLSAAEQHRVFERHTRRRVVLATNVAETSLTVPGITSVIDTGLARISRWSARTKVQRLPIEAISQASAQQRSGRCGRIEAGVAIRLYSQEDFEGRPEFTEPEILRTSLASVILQMTSLGLGEVERFPFVDPPDQRAVRAGVQLLEELGALTGTSEGGARGRSRLKLTGDRTQARPAADRPADGPDDPGGRPAGLPARGAGDHRGALDPGPARATGRAPGSCRPAARAVPRPALGLPDLDQPLAAPPGQAEGDGVERLPADVPRGAPQLPARAGVAGLRVAAAAGGQAGRAQVGTRPHRDRGAGRGRDPPGAALGLLSHIGLRDQDRRDYLGARGTRFSIFPGSGLFKSQPDLVMAAELVETSRLYARQNAAIDPVWAERLGGDLVKRTYSEPYWSKKRESALAHERATLYGVPLVADRVVPLGRHQPDVARELFIRHALVLGEWRARHRFFETNRRLLEEAAQLEHRARRHDIVVDEETLFDFYDARIPPDVISGAHFDTWWKQERRTSPELLTFDPTMLVHEGASLEAGDFPDEWREDRLSLPLHYHFEPGHEADGVTIDVPVATLNTVGEAPFTWNVPGLRQDLVTALIRSLPKRLRVNFVPAPDVARRFLDAVPPGDEALVPALSRYLRSLSGVHVPEEAWDLSKVPEHLRPTFRVVDDEGREVGVGKDLEALKQPLRPSFDRAMRQVADESGVTATEQTTWTFGTIETSFTRTRAGHEVRGFPTLVDEGATVGLRVAASADEQEARHRLGVRRLLLLAVPSPASKLLDGLDNTAKLGLAASPYPNVRALVDDCVTAAAGELVDQTAPVRDPEGFAALVARAGAELPARSEAVLQQVLRVLAEWRPVDKALHGRVEMSMLPAMTDLRAQLGRLVAPGFIGEAGADALRHYPRYLKAMTARVDRLGELARDRELMDRVEVLQQAWQHRVDALPAGRPPGADLRRVRWMLEELRVSLWAQQLGTAQPVSDARIRKALG